MTSRDAYGHSYTLECNYNSGRSCNGISAATCDDGRVTPPRPGTAIPCKYTTACYEEARKHCKICLDICCSRKTVGTYEPVPSCTQVGRGLAVAALDIIGANPWSRLPTSKYNSVHGTRQWVLLHISRMRAKESNKKRLNKITTTATPWK